MLMMVKTADQIEPQPDVCYFVMLAEPNRELTAQANLIIRHVPFYLPTIFRAGRLRARDHEAGLTHPDIAVPLFPRMIFVAESVVQQMLGLIRSTPGMQRDPFLTFGNKPDGSRQFALVRPLAMRAIQVIEAEERQKYFSRKRKGAAPSWIPEVGQEVRFLVDEVLGGLQGKVDEVDDKGRIAIFTELMKRTVRVHATSNQIEPV